MTYYMKRQLMQDPLHLQVYNRVPYYVIKRIM